MGDATNKLCILACEAQARHSHEGAKAPRLGAMHRRTACSTPKAVLEAGNCASIKIKQTHATIYYGGGMREAFKDFNDM